MERQKSPKQIATLKGAGYNEEQIAQMPYQVASDTIGKIIAAKQGGVPSPPPSSNTSQSGGTFPSGSSTTSHSPPGAQIQMARMNGGKIAAELVNGGKLPFEQIFDFADKWAVFVVTGQWRQ